MGIYAKFRWSFNLKMQKILNSWFGEWKSGNIFFTLKDVLKKKGSVGMYRVIVSNCMPNFTDIVHRVAKISCS